jgi:cytochrome c-type biogenesis protein CcmH/NrfF
VTVAGYVTSGILTWAIPLGVLALIGVYWAIFVRRHPREF